MDRRDCNNCRHLSITEEEQNRLKARGERRLHICLKFRKAVFHRANTKEHDSYIYPCTECAGNGFERWCK